MPRQGKQFTYALLEERVPPVRVLEREEALAGLTTRYFTSRGPATPGDFAYWSGLTMKDVKEGIAMVRPNFECEVLDGKEYIFAPNKLKNENEVPMRLLYSQH